MDTTDLTITHERLDDLPLIFAMAERLKLAAVLDNALGRHGNHEGLSYGWLATVWIAYILSEGDHRKSAVEGWAQQRKGTLGLLTGQQLRDHELSDDRLGQLLARLAEPETWQAIESALWSQSAMAFKLECQRVRLDSTTSYGYHQAGEEGLMQLGHSKDYRPDKPQLKLMAAVAEPADQMLCSSVYPGNSADDGLYVPMIERVRQIAGTELLYIGDAKMAAQSTREAIAAGGDDYLTRLPKPARRNEMEAWVDRALDGEINLVTIFNEDGSVFGAGYDFEREIAGETSSWTERVIVYRSDAHADGQRGKFQERIAKATEAIQALTPPVGRGKRQFREVKALTAAIGRIEKRNGVQGLLGALWETEAWPSREEPDRIRHMITHIHRFEERIKQTEQHLGWQVLVTSVDAETLATADTVPLYNDSWKIEMQIRDVKDRPLGIRPLHVTRDDQITGLTHLVTLALRIMTLITTTVRRSLARTGEELHGLYEGQKVRTTDRPTARRILRAFHRHEITMTRIRSPGQEVAHLAPLPDVLTAILTHLGLSEAIYTDLTAAAK